MSTIVPSRTATSAVRAGAPVPSTTVPPRITRSTSATTGGVRPVHLERVGSEELRARVRLHPLGCLAQLVDDAGILRVAVREVAGPDEAVGADDRRQYLRCDLAGVE